MALALALWAGLAGAPGAAQEMRAETQGFGLRLEQGGAPVIWELKGAVYSARLAPGPFAIGPARTPDGTLLLSIGIAPEVFGRFGDPADPLFGPASGYARELEPGATLYFSDPVCRLPGLGTGFNILLPEHGVSGMFPVERIEPDRSSDDCSAPGHVVPGTSLIRPGARLFLVVSDGEGADFLMLAFEAPPSS